MVASIQLEIPNYRSAGQQLGRWFGSFAQNIGRTAIPVLHEYIVPATKRVGADLFEFAAPEIVRVVTGRKTLKQLQRMWEVELWENTWLVAAGKNFKQNHSTKFCKTNQSVVRRDFFKQFSIIMLNVFAVQTFAAVSGKTGNFPVVEVVYVWLEQEIYPITSLDESCIETSFETDWNYYID